MAKRVQDLQCWRLADELRTEVYAICAQEEVAKRFRFCDGFTEAAGSVCHNLSEGFERFDSGPIVQFFGYAVASLAEVEDYLRECLARKFIDRNRYEKSLEIAEHARASTLNFKRHHERKLREKSGRQRRHRTSSRT